MKLNEIFETIDSTLPAGSQALRVTEYYEPVFGAFYDSPAEYFLRSIGSMLSENSGAALLKNKENFMLNCTNDLIADYMGIVMSTIIIELYQSKDQGVYSSEDIYNDFCNDLKKPSFMKKLAEKYPCMFSLIYKMADDRVKLIGSCLERVYANRDAIADRLGVCCDSIENLSVSTGDSHNGGNKVVLVHTSEGTVVYKPHTLSPEKLFEQVVAAVSGHGTIKHSLNTVKTLSFSDYGFQEFIRQKPVSGVDEASRYYYRIGAFSAIFDAIKCEDLHYENLICSGENPYFIDLETLVRNKEQTSEAQRNNGFLYNVLNEISDSVMGTMLYPLNSSLCFFDFDMGGISASPHGKSHKWQSYKIINTGTDKIRFMTGEGQISEANNLLYCNGKAVVPSVFAKEISEGYRDAMEAVIAERDKLAGMFVNSDCVVRRVLRPTAMYGKFLKVSYAPQFFTSDAERIRLFSKLFKGFENNDRECRRIECEIDALMNNDIPYFSQAISGKSLVANMNTTVDDYNTAAPVDNVVYRLNHIDELYIRRQLRYLYMSLSTDTRKADTRENFGRSFNAGKLPLGEDFIEAAENIGEYLAEMAITNKENNAVSWLTESQTDRFLVDSANSMMYECGAISLFLLYLGNCAGNSKWLDYAEKTLNGFELLGYAKPSGNISFFVGNAGMMYIYYSFYCTTGKTEYLDKLISLADSCLEAVKNEAPVIEGDIIRGAAGTVTVLTRISRQVNISSVDELLAIAADALAAMIDDGTFPEMTGFAHGYAGASLALAEYGNYTGDERYTALAGRAIEAENIHFSEEYGNWRDLRENGGFGTYWCHGAPGIGLSRAMTKSLGDFELDNDIKAGTDCLIEKGFDDKMDHSLCHGVFGTIDMLLSYGNLLGDRKLCTLAAEKAREYIAEIGTTGFRAGYDGMAITPSFMIGITGVGYTLLRLAFPEIPSVIALDVPKIRRNNVEQNEYTDCGLYAVTVS